MGPITIELDPEKAPITVENFLKYVDDEFYDNLIFHRVIPGFMIQGGGFDEQMKEKEEGQRGPIKNESGNGLSNVRGTIAMARTQRPELGDRASSSSTSSTTALAGPGRRLRRLRQGDRRAWTWSTRSPRCRRPAARRRRQPMDERPGRAGHHQERSAEGQELAALGVETVVSGGTLDRPGRGL